LPTTLPRGPRLFPPADAVGGRPTTAGAGQAPLACTLLVAPQRTPSADGPPRQGPDKPRWRALSSSLHSGRRHEEGVGCPEQAGPLWPVWWSRTRGFPHPGRAEPTRPLWWSTTACAPGSGPAGPTCSWGFSDEGTVRCGGARDAARIPATTADLVVWKVRALPDDARSVATSSGLTIHGIVRHLVDVERSWLRRWFAGQPGVPVDGIDRYHVGEPRARRRPGGRLRRGIPALRRGRRGPRARRPRGQRTGNSAPGPAPSRRGDHAAPRHLDRRASWRGGRTGEEPVGGTSPGSLLARAASRSGHSTAAVLETGRGVGRGPDSVSSR
jgi:hypothetical protein